MLGEQLEPRIREQVHEAKCTTDEDTGTSKRGCADADFGSRVSLSTRNIVSRALITACGEECIDRRARAQHQFMGLAFAARGAQRFGTVCTPCP